MASTAPASVRVPKAVWYSSVLALRPLHAGIAAPSWLFLAALTAMLFRPPDLKLYGIDRIAFLVLMGAVYLRALVLRQPLRIPSPVALPLGLLLVAAVGGAALQPYQPEAWSVLAAKWIVPFGMFYAARLIFTNEKEIRRLEIFFLLVLAYLTFTAILFLVGNTSLIFPPFIADEGLGIHADRARGPFLQAVANGVSLNLLGLIALDSYRRGRLKGLPALALVIGLPLAILATKTRGVWASFDISVGTLLLFSPSARVRRVCLSMVVAACFVLLGALVVSNTGRSMEERLEDRSPVQFRLAVYHAGWEMFLAKPLLGWGTAQMQPELARRISDFHQDDFYFHNTFLEVAVEYGVVGLALYLWVLVDLLRLGGKKRALMPARPGHFFDLEFRSLWPVLLGVYLLNACFVVMNYQFVNGIVFTQAGILAAQNEG